MGRGITDPQPLAQEGQWEMGWGGGVVTILLSFSCWCWYETLHAPVRAKRMTHKPAVEKLMPRDGLGSSIIALNDQLLWFRHSYLPRVHMCPEAGLRQVWHMPSLDSGSLCSSIIVSFYPKGLLWGPCFLPCPWAWFKDTLAHWEVLLKSRDSMQTSLLLLGILYTKGVWSPYGLFYRQWALANISVTYKSHSNDSLKNKENHPRWLLV